VTPIVGSFGTLGIDVAKRSHRATLLDEDGQAVFRNLAVVMERVNLLIEQTAQLDAQLQYTGKGAAAGRMRPGG